MNDLESLEATLPARLEQRRHNAAAAWNLSNELVLIGAGERIGIPGRGDRFSALPLHRSVRGHMPCAVSPAMRLRSRQDVNTGGDRRSADERMILAGAFERRQRLTAPPTADGNDSIASGQ